MIMVEGYGAGFRNSQGKRRICFFFFFEDMVLGDGDTWLRVIWIGIIFFSVIVVRQHCFIT